MPQADSIECVSSCLKSNINREFEMGHTRRDKQFRYNVGICMSCKIDGHPP